MEFIATPLCVRFCFPVWCLPLALCFPPAIMLQHLSWAAIPGAFLDHLPFLRREQERCCTMTVLLLKVNPVGISLYSSYDDISLAWDPRQKMSPRAWQTKVLVKALQKRNFGKDKLQRNFLAELCDTKDYLCPQNAPDGLYSLQY